jgi:hypothetical protein
VHAGERSFGIATLHCCEKKSYSGSLHIQSDTYVRDAHYNGRQSSLPEGDEEVVYMMTCSPLTASKDLEVLIREGIIKLCPQGLVTIAYEAL